MTEPSATGARARRRLVSPLFSVAVFVLMTAAGGLRPAISALTTRYGKEPIDLRAPLEAFDGTRLTSFRPVTGFASIALGEGDVETEDVISPVFEAIGDLDRPGADDQVMLFVTYYSDPRSQIPHTPEVCYRQSGAQVTDMKAVTIETPGLAPITPSVEALRLDIDNHGRRTVVAYVIVANGRFLHDREAARFVIGWPGDKHTYFSKVEAVTACPTQADFAPAVERCKRLLAEALPILVEDHFPTRQQIAR